MVFLILCRNCNYTIYVFCNSFLLLYERIVIYFLYWYSSYAGMIDTNRIWSCKNSKVVDHQNQWWAMIRYVYYIFFHTTKKGPKENLEPMLCQPIPGMIHTSAVEYLYMTSSLMVIDIPLIKKDNEDWWRCSHHLGRNICAMWSNTTVFLIFIWWWWYK